MKEFTVIAGLGLLIALLAVGFFGVRGPDPNHVDLKVACDKVETAGAGAVVWECEDAQGVFYYTKSGTLVHQVGK